MACTFREQVSAVYEALGELAVLVGSADRLPGRVDAVTVAKLDRLARDLMVQLF